MFCLSCRPLVKLNEEGRKINKKLENLTFVYAFLALIKLILGDFNNFLNDIFLILILTLSYIQANFIMTAFSIFMILFQTFFTTIAILLLVQNYLFGLVDFSLWSWIQYLYFFVILSCLALNIMLTYYSFLAYREYKATFYEESGRIMVNQAYNYSIEK